MQLILQLARAIAMQDTKLAMKVCWDLPELKGIVEVGANSVWVLDQSALDDMSQGIARRSIEIEFEMISSSDGSKPRSGRNASLHRQSQLWAPLCEEGDERCDSSKRRFGDPGRRRESFRIGKLLG